MSNNGRSPFLTVVMIAVVILLTVAIILWFKPNSSSVASTQLASTTTGRPITDSESNLVSSDQGTTTSPTQGNTPFITGLENLPRSLQGTTVDGEIIIDENKQLVVTEGLRRLFDYFLSAFGEEDESVIHERVKGIFVITHQSLLPVKPLVYSINMWRISKHCQR